jgi:hypothetical protein
MSGSGEDRRDPAAGIDHSGRRPVETGSPGRGTVPRSRSAQLEWVLRQATRFLDDIRREIEKTSAHHSDFPPRLRMVHERPNHATPDYRNLAIHVPAHLGGASPEALSELIAQHAGRRPPTCLLLGLEAEQEAGEVPRSLLIAEVRDRAGTRLFWMQPFSRRDTEVIWEEALEGGWRDPGAQEMILDAAFTQATPR